MNQEEALHLEKGSSDFIAFVEDALACHGDPVLLRWAWRENQCFVVFAADVIMAAPQSLLSQDITNVDVAKLREMFSAIVKAKDCLAERSRRNQLSVSSETVTDTGVGPAGGEVVITSRMGEAVTFDTGTEKFFEVVSSIEIMNPSGERIVSQSLTQEMVDAMSAGATPRTVIHRREISGITAFHCWIQDLVADLGIPNLGDAYQRSCQDSYIGCMVLSWLEAHRGKTIQSDDLVDFYETVVAAVRANYPGRYEEDEYGEPE